MFAKAVKLALTLALIPAAFVFAADTKIKILEHPSGAGAASGGPPLEITVYVHGHVQRVDYVGYPVSFTGPRKEPAPHTAFIIRCDAHIAYEIDFNHREYRKYWLDKFPSQDRLEKAMTQDQKDNRQFRQINTVDTGETKDFYGHVAKHVVTIIKGTATHPYEEVVDGWYLDIPDPGCAPEYLRERHVHMETVEATNSGAPGFIYSHADGVPSDISAGAEGFPLVVLGPIPQGLHFRLWYNWLLPSGLPVQVTSTAPVGLATQMTSTSDQPVERIVVEFSEAPIDPSLFELPPGFKKVRKF
ncbi:MAG TPA: hypothetical protein VN176_12165 [Verrucomicrobiae bacterium]|jgi:hypothetical protein|nr:hypothetical protein [Verrucomicrobiae bacterium]